MIKYTHVERLGMDQVEGILNGTVFVQPKIDGSNGQIFLDESKRLKCASRNMELDASKTNQGFWNHVHESITTPLFELYFAKHPYNILYGEWLVPHTLKTYRKDAWKKFYIFDVYDSVSGLFLSFPKWVDDVHNIGLRYIPMIGKLYKPTEEKLVKYLENNTFLIEDGKGSGEGIVIKNFSFINKYGRVAWAKLVKNEFKEEHIRVMGINSEESKKPVELKIAEEFVTEGRLNKIKTKMVQEDVFDSRRIPEYLGRVWFEIVTDEMWNILKKYKNPTIDFRALNKAVIQTIKNLDKEVF